MCVNFALCIYILYGRSTFVKMFKDGNVVYIGGVYILGVCWFVMHGYLIFALLIVRPFPDVNKAVL